MNRIEYAEKFNNLRRTSWCYIPQEGEVITQTPECDYHFESNTGTTFSVWGKRIRIIQPKPKTREEIIEEAVLNLRKWIDNSEDQAIKFGQCEAIPYWAVADEGECVVSFYCSEEPQYLRIQHNEQGRAFVVSGRGSNSKTHYIHILQAEAFPERVYAYGKAKTSTEGTEIHHIEGHAVNKPESEERLTTNAHVKLFDKRSVSLLSDNVAKDMVYESRVLEVVTDETPDQTVVVFSGAGKSHGEETKDLKQVVYADDYQGVKELADKALESLNSMKIPYILYRPNTSEDVEGFIKLLQTEDGVEKLEAHVVGIINLTKTTAFTTTYKGVGLDVFLLIK